MKLLLIGMGPGIGLSVARQFGREGFEILMIGREMDKMRVFEQELRSAGIPATGYAQDIADEQAYHRLLGQIAGEHPDIDILHYNASAFNPALPSEMALPVFKDDLQINVTGALMAVQTFFPHFKARGNGTMFFTGGSTALHAPANLFSLGIGKAAMRNLSLALTEECAPYGVRVATLTIWGMVRPNTANDPNLIAGEFWRIYNLPDKAWQPEVMWGQEFSDGF